MDFKNTEKDLHFHDKEECTTMSVKEKDFDGEDFMNFNIDDSDVYVNLEQATELSEKINRFIQKASRKKYDKGEYNVR